jgi:hypothetical protein
MMRAFGYFPRARAAAASMATRWSYRRWRSAASASSCALALPQPRQPASRAGQAGREFVPATIAVLAVLALVDLGGLAQDLGDLGLELVVGAVGLLGGVAGHLGAVEGDGADPDHPGGRAQPQGLHEEAGQGSFVADPEPGDVTWSGVWLPVSTRKARSSRQRRSIWREERIPMA